MNVSSEQQENDDDQKSSKFILFFLLVPTQKLFRKLGGLKVIAGLLIDKNTEEVKQIVAKIGSLLCRGSPKTQGMSIEGRA
jgi:hypothetical protein